ncbi:MAG: PD-(D/E)XK nuclease family protein [Pseudomonadota bacterium]
MPAPGGAALPHAVARHLLERHADRLPDLSGITVLVPNHRAGQDFTRALARAAARPALIPPDIVPLKAWAERVANGRAEPHAARLARLHGVLRHQDWLGTTDRWALAAELLQLADALSAARPDEAVGNRLRALHGGRLDREIALVEAVWHTLNSDGCDPQARYARALDTLADGFAAAPRPLLGFGLGQLTAIERRFLARCAEHAPVELFGTDAADPRVNVLQQAWCATEPPLAERARKLAAEHPVSPIAGTLRVAPAPHLEAEARAVAAWVAAQLNAGRRAIALIALDRETARRVRALLDRMDVLIADETGWTLSTTAAAAALDRWLECVASDFPHVELLDLLKSPFVLGEPSARQDAVLAFELALRRRGVSQGLADMQHLARTLFGELPPWFAALTAAAHAFPRTRAPLAVWLTRLDASLDALAARTPLGNDAAGRALLDALGDLRRTLAADSEKYSFAEWRHWLDRALESASFSDTAVASSVVLTSLPAARGRLFEAVAVIGADARHLPPVPASGLFSQTTRAALDLPTAHDDAEAAIADLVTLVAPAQTLFSWQAWHDDEPNPASPLVLRLSALHRAAWGVDLPRQHAGVPPAQTSPALAAVTQPAPRVAPAVLPRRYSASSYQTLLDCPYRFFVERVLDVRALDEADDPLDKSDYGSALHRILKRFHDSDPPCERDVALARLAEFTRAEFAGLPAWTAVAWASRWDALQPAYIDAWLAWVAQGWRYASGEAEFAISHTVNGLGEITLFGVLDRVDVRALPDGDLLRAVFDYKTGAARALKEKLSDPGEAVQLPFYAWLAHAAAAYLPLGDTPIAALDLDGETDVAAISLRLPALLEAIAAGSPLTASGIDRDCRTCDARGLCRKGMWHA